MHIYFLLLVTLKHHFREVCLHKLEEALRIGALSCVQFIIAPVDRPDRQTHLVTSKSWRWPARVICLYSVETQENA